MAPPPGLQTLRFGVFEVDRSASKLVKGGRRVKLAPQPFKVLLLLLDRHGQVVSRTDIQCHLWGESTFVDFDRGINFSINQIRAALSDDADRPRYIETVPRLGYRFVGEVTNGAGTEPLAHAAQAVERKSDLPELSRCEADRPDSHRALRLTAAPFLRFAAVAILAAIAFFAAGMAVRKSPRPVDSIQSIAVLPLEDLSSSKVDEYFADGVTDQLITDLGQLARLRVISRTSIMQYKRAFRPLPQIARELGVDAVVEGTITRSGNRVRVTGQLIEARTDRLIWANAYETEMGDVLPVERELAEVIADEVRGKISSIRHPVPKRVRSLTAPAQNAYLKGHYLQQTGTIESLPEAISYFERSVAIEPNAPAYAGTASAYVAMGHMMFLPPQQAFLPAKTAALKALELDDTLEEAHTALGSVKLLYEWDFPRAATEFQRALDLNPSSVQAQSAYADYLTVMGHANEAIERARLGVELDPLSLSAIMNLAWQLYRGRQYEQAVAEAQTVADIEPASSSAHTCLGLAYGQQHRFPKAIEELRKASALCRDRCFGLIGQVFAMSGDRQAALDAMHQLQRRAYASPWLAAVIYAQLGDKDRAFAWLEKAYEGREHDLVFAGAWPVFDTLRADPRYANLLRRVGLPQ
jgi:TolB-like protein/DNA-binding winged helix-turn-helix (wHTH) protein/Tfp pilus assembly protein PilF